MKAVILCAGLGTRARPATFVRPKPLLIIGGMPLVERSIKLLQEDGITDITLVTGYKAEMFEPLRQRCSVELRRCPSYAQTNNHASLLLAADKLDDCLVLDGDLYLRRPVRSLLQPGVSQFLAQKTAFGTEWALLTDQEGKITGVTKDAPSGYSMSGVSYWKGEAARLLALELEKSSPEDYWEDAAIRILPRTDVYMTAAPQFQTEIDDCYDGIRLKLLTPDELALQCDEREKAERLGGLTNSNYLITMGGRKVVLRIPGLGSEAIIDRTQEPRLLSLIDGMAITPESVFYPNGIKTSVYLDGYRMLQPEDLNAAIFARLSGRLRQLHAIRQSVCPEGKQFSVISEMSLYERQTSLNLLDAEERAEFSAFAEELDHDPKVLCHRDLLLENIMINNDDLKLIDFEYAAFTSAYWDIASFLTEARLNPEQTRQFIDCYGGLDPGRVQRARILVDYIWALWGFFKGYITYGRARMAEMHFEYERYKQARC